MSKEHVGARVRKRYDIARTPYQRVLECPEVPEATKAELRARYETLNPVRLLRDIDRCQDQLWVLERVRFVNEATIAAQ